MKLGLKRSARSRSPQGSNTGGRVTAAEMYDVQDTHVRFNQKDHMGSQMIWEAQYKAQRDQLKVKQRQLTEKGRAGFEATAWGLESAADSLLTLMSFSKNQADTKATAWQSKQEPAPTGRPETSPAEASQMVRKAAALFGADQVGFAILDRRWVYSHYFDEETKKDFPIKFSDEPGYEQYDQPIRLDDGTRVIPKEMQYVVVLLHEWGKNLDGTEHAPTLLTEGLSTLAYARMAPTLWMLAEFIRGLGYNAIPAANDTALSIPLAVDAGLGQLGRHGPSDQPEGRRPLPHLQDLHRPAPRGPRRCRLRHHRVLQRLPQVRPQVRHQGHHHRRTHLRAPRREQRTRRPLLEGRRQEVHDLPEPRRQHLQHLCPPLRLDQAPPPNVRHTPLLHPQLPLALAQQDLGLARRPRRPRQIRQKS